MTFCINKIVWTGKCFGFKQWQLPSKGNSFSRGLGGESKVCDVIWEGWGGGGGKTGNEMGRGGGGG